MTVRAEWAVLACALAIAGCRFGLGDGDDELGFARPRATAGQPAPAEPERPEAGRASSAPDAGSPRIPDRAVEDDAGRATDAVSCGESAQSQGCDPRSNLGCADVLGMQCDVDLATKGLAGVCVFSAPAMDPNS